MENLTEDKIKEIQIKANDIRKDIITMLANAGSGHTAGALGMADIFALLYFHILKHKPSNPRWTGRDRLVLSNGHICPVLYASMSQAGYFDKNEILKLRKFGSMLQGHPHREFMDFIETSSGPLGEGLGQALGMALAEKIDNGIRTIYAVLSDGEHDEGNTWESIMLANKYKLSNLIVIVDRNKIQIGGNTEKVMPLENLKEKYENFGWYAQEVNGHNIIELNNAIKRAQDNKARPSVIIAHTIPGKGIKSWEGDYRWHGKAPTKEEAKMALEELEKNYA